MQISNHSTGVSFNPVHACHQGLKKVNKVLHASVERVNKYEMAYKRIRRIRSEIELHKTNTKPYSQFDEVLSNPMVFKNTWIRRLIYTAERLEEMGEACADLSSLAEKIARNLFSCGKKSDLIQIGAAALGRSISAQTQYASWSIPKLAGSGLFCLSAILSVLAIKMANTKLGSRVQTPHSEIAAELQQIQFRTLAKKLQRGKECILHKTEKFSNSHAQAAKPVFKKILNSLSRQNTQNDGAYPRSHRMDCDYMLRHTHQYGRLNKALLKTAFYTFNVVNKLLCSYDKHIAMFVVEKGLAKLTGEILGARLALTVTAAAAAVVGFFCSQVGFALATVGMVACGFAFALVVAAKLNAQYRGNWKGDICPPKNSSFG